MILNRKSSDTKLKARRQNRK